MDASAFARTYRSHVGHVRARCRRIVRDAALAEDVAQEAFARLWRDVRLDDAGTAAIAAWLYRTSTHLAIDALRTRKREAKATWPTHTSEQGSDEIVAARRCLEGVGRSVPAQELEAAVHVRVGGLAHADAASAMGISERTVRRLLGRFDRRTGALRGVLAVAIALVAILAGRSCSAAGPTATTAADVGLWGGAP